METMPEIEWEIEQIKLLQAELKLAMPEMTRVAELEAENAALRAEIASQTETIKTLSNHIAEHMDDAEGWLDSYIGSQALGQPSSEKEVGWF